MAGNKSEVKGDKSGTAGAENKPGKGGQGAEGGTPPGETGKELPKEKAGEEQGGLQPSEGVLQMSGPTARDMFGSFMVAVASRTPSMHKSAAEIAVEAEKLTAEWIARKDKFADE